MAQVIMMAKEYNCTPADIIGLGDEYERYCFNEVAFILYIHALEKDGKIRWNKIRWKDSGSKPRNNKAFMEHIRSKRG